LKKGRIGLVTILTDNIPSMKEFYRDVLGFEVNENLGNYVEFANEGVRFAICTREVMHEGTSHPSYKEQRVGQGFELAFPLDSPEEVDQAYDEIVSKGATPIKGPEMMPWGRRTAFFADPEGNIHELYSLKPGERV
jgi:catechol 2,3-dioxygenase-like lactoylglutathione lyase family enzyme